MAGYVESRMLHCEPMKANFAGLLVNLSGVNELAGPEGSRDPARKATAGEIVMVRPESAVRDGPCTKIWNRPHDGRPRRFLNTKGIQ